MREEGGGGSKAADLAVLPREEARLATKRFQWILKEIN